MKKILMNRKNMQAAPENQRDVMTAKERLLYAVEQEEQQLRDFFGLPSEGGMTEEQAERLREEYGDNDLPQGETKSLMGRLLDAFIDPFSLVLLALAFVSLWTDVLLAPVGEKNGVTVLIILVMVLISGLLRFVQETKSEEATAMLTGLLHTTTAVERRGTGVREIPMDEVVCGDIVKLSAGDMIPADIRILEHRDLFLTQAPLTGESEHVEKSGGVQKRKEVLTDNANLAFMGSAVISGTATGMVIATGSDTLLGEISQQVGNKTVTGFEKGIQSVSWLLIRFMAIMVPVVFVINGLTKKDWMHALLFAISIAVGLTPEMLPMIVTTGLAKGAVTMSKRKVIVKDLRAIQNLGGMDLLCTDKTGTLTEDNVVLELYLDIHGRDDSRVLRHGFLNSYFQTGLKNLMDRAIIQRTEKNSEKDPSLRGLKEKYRKVDEVPFDFERRCMSVVVADATGKTQLITKGAVEEMIRACSYVEYEGRVVPLEESLLKVIEETAESLNDRGLRVLAVAQKTNPPVAGEFSSKDERDMVLIGFLAFMDPPKETAREAIEALQEHGVRVKILTGDNEKVTRSVCRQVGLPADHILLGSEVEAMEDEELKEVLEETQIFAKLSPMQKARIVNLTREMGHITGYMGDGINDAAAMKASDVGISVDTAVDIARESAQVILLEKNLMVIEEGILEGRKIYGNIMKYIRMTASSNFGNVFAVLVASAFLPFLPMTSIQLIFLNLIYDFTCIAIPWDNVDEEYLARPRPWDASDIGRFMVGFGPLSSLFDILTYVLLYFVLCPLMSGGVSFHALKDPVAIDYFIALFRTGWFVESMWTQTLVVHMIRTEKIPLIQSRASMPVNVATGLGILLVTLLPYTALGGFLELTSLPLIYFPGLMVIVLGYMAAVHRVKKRFVTLR